MGREIIVSPVAQLLLPLLHTRSERSERCLLTLELVQELVRGSCWLLFSRPTFPLVSAHRVLLPGSW